MGGYTKNLQLYKADVVENANDTFNIETMLNDNWDKIDEKLEKLPVQNGGLYINSETTEEDKAEAQKALAELGYGIKTYTSLEQLGTSDDVYSTTDFEANLEELGRYIPAYSQYWQSITNNTNIALSIKAKILNDLGISVPSGFNMSVFIRRPSTVQQMVADVMIDTNSADYNNKIFTCSYNWNSTGGFWTKFIVSQHPAGFLPLDGSVPMSGSLVCNSSFTYLYGKLGRLLCEANRFQIDICNVAGNFGARRILTLYNSIGEENIGDALLISNSVNGAIKAYKIFGEHNKPSGSYTGNGSSTTREVDIYSTTSIRNMILAIKGGGHLTLVSNAGVLCVSSSGTSVSVGVDKAMFDSGILTLKTNYDCLNKSGETYYYQVL